MHLMEGRARAAAIYPKQLCMTVCKATLSQAKMDAVDMVCVECIDQPNSLDEVNEVFEDYNWENIGTTPLGEN